MPAHKFTYLQDKPNICELCGSTKTDHWLDKDGLKVCKRCYTNNRKFIHGLLNPDGLVGMSVITEHITYEVLGDCEKCNNRDNFCSSYDLISKALGTINVKSSTLRSNRWLFSKLKNQTIPDYYICIGFNKDKTEILKVFIIPGNSNIITKYGITIMNSTKGLKRVIKYEVDPKPYNNIYINLNIQSLTEFENIV